MADKIAKDAMVNVAVDAMGGDNAPGEVVKGAVEAIQEDKRIKVFLVGKEPLIAEIQLSS